jgi:hypothetical protein
VLGGRLWAERRSREDEILLSGGGGQGVVAVFRQDDGQRDLESMVDDADGRVRELASELGEEI